MNSGTGTSFFDSDQTGVGRAAVRGAIVAFFIVAGTAAGISWLAGADPWPAVGIGAFAGFWGGPGFGAMLGAIVYLARERKVDPAATQTAPAAHDHEDQRVPYLEGASGGHGPGVVDHGRPARPTALVP